MLYVYFSAISTRSILTYIFCNFNSIHININTLYIFHVFRINDDNISNIHILCIFFFDLRLILLIEKIRQIYCRHCFWHMTHLTNTVAASSALRNCLIAKTSSVEGQYLHLPTPFTPTSSAC